MQITSIIGLGANDCSCEIGKFGGTPEQAISWFTDKCKEIGYESNEITVLWIGRAPTNGLSVTIPFGEKNWDLLKALDAVGDIGGDPPHQYRFEPMPEVPEGEYVNTGQFFD